ncbi:MAG: tyrosine-type recombinase/integrase [Candidatus Firestonebacteria bacterium]|nr:tyrosine-type recombinase/integrase [Candidatus Firestonebacteria bacterium]
MSGAGRFRFYDCRHTYVSQLVMSEADILSVKELLGHRDLKTTLIYAHLAPKRKIEAVKLMKDILVRS